MITANTLADSKTVLLVDDDQSTVNLYSRGLEQAGFRTTAACDADQQFETLPADLIILNLMQPKRGGLELLQAIRADGLHKDTPVLLLSNPYLPDLAQKGLKAGGNKALPKSECTSYQLVSVSRQLVGIDGASVGLDPSDEPAADLAEQLTRELMERGSAEVASIRQLCSSFVAAARSEQGSEHLDQVYQSIRFLSTRAGLAGCRKIAQLAGAIEAMLFDHLLRSNSAMSPSTIQTMVQSVQCLEHLFTSADTWSAETTGKARVLLVDDDQVSNRANEVALKRASYDTFSATSGIEALILLNKNRFDLILLDINMPTMNGIELCQKLRSIPHHKATPVIFVTLVGDFQSRAQSLLSGGDDLISKPISPLELIVKATVFLLDKSKSQTPKEPPRLQVRTTPVAPPGALPFTGSESPGPRPTPSRLEDPANKALPASMFERLASLTEALAEETKRREEVEEQAADNATRRRELEAAIEENQKSQAWFEQLLQESEQQALAAEQSGEAGQQNLTGRRRALLEVSNFVADKLFKLKQALAEETRRREAVEQEIAQNAKRRAELEAALAEIQKVQEAFRSKLEMAGDPSKLLQLQQSLSLSPSSKRAPASCKPAMTT
jgi:DNA-binding response OmpR family regulator